MANIHSELQNFSGFLFQEVLESAGDPEKGKFLEEVFTQWVMDLMSDSGETGNVQLCRGTHHNKTGNRTRQINGYGLWDSYETLDIFITSYRHDAQLYTLDKTRMLVNLNLAARYLDYTFKGEIHGIEESTAEREFLENFKSFRNELNRVRLILLTNGLTKAEIPDAKTALGEMTVIREVWDLERIYRLWSSGKKREPIEVNLPADYKQKISCLSLNKEKDGYMAYISIVPGRLLADLYEDFGSRLLEQNVRVYLQNKGKVNKEMRKTIIEDPGMFMAYNNGISATATEIKFVKDKDTGEKIIGAIRGLQIVNGGQTTSSIYYAWKRDRRPIADIYLQMKITLIKDDKKTATVVSRISKYANSQNNVTEIDLTSNQTFHIIMEEISRTTLTPSRPGIPYQTRWYYERAKGQYREDLNKERKPSEKTRFKERNPSWQVFRKEELSKYRNTWNLLPYWVARGSQKNYLFFMTQEAQREPTRLYFRETAALAILFKAGERLYGKKPEAMGDLRFIVVPYAMAWLNHHTSGQLNLEEIWEIQELPPELNSLFRDVLFRINDFFQKKKPSQYALVSEWAKKEECWSMLKNISPKTMGISFKKIEKHLAEKEGDEIATSREARIRTIPVEQWEKIEQTGKETGLLSPLLIGLVRNIISRLEKGRPISSQQVEQAEKVLEISAAYGK